MKIEMFIYYKFCSNSVKRAKSEGKKSTISQSEKVHSSQNPLITSSQRLMAANTTSISTVKYARVYADQ
jgi:hypothetical protein